MSGTPHPLKVAHVLRRFTFEEWGGTETVVWNTALNQRARGIDAEILCTAALSEPGEEIRSGVPIRRFKYWYPYFPMPRSARLELDKKGGNPFAPDLFRVLRTEKFDLIHIHCGGRLSVMCALLARKLHIPCVISLHGGFADVPKEELRKMMSPTKGKFHYGGIFDRIFGLRRNVIGETDAVICISRREEELLREQFPDRRIVYLPNGVNCEDFREKPPCSPRREWNIPDDRRLVLCISRIDYQKNQKLLLELPAHDPKCHVLLIGPVTAPWYHQELLEQAQKTGVADRLTVIPGLPPDDPRLKAILHEADLFILPSLHEPFGIVILEAWSAGIPVIASNAGGLKDFIQSGRNGLLFDPAHGEELVQHYDTLIGDPGRRQALAAAALEDVRNYSWSALSLRLLELYEDLRHGQR